MKRVLFVMLILAGCNSPQDSSVKVIVGAKLIVTAGREPIEYSVVVVDGKKFREVGTQASTPVPKGAEMTRGLGLTIEPVEGGMIAAGQPANLILKGSPDRVMRDGEWVK